MTTAAWTHSNYAGSHSRFQNMVVQSDGSMLLPSDVQKWNLRVYDTRTGQLVKHVVKDSTTTTGYFYATAQTGNGWSKNSTGYNFEYVLDGTAFPQVGGRSYRLEFKINTVDDGVIYVVWNLSCKETMS